MPELKTQRNEGDVDAFINSVEDDVRRRDAAEVKEIMTRLCGQPPTMWGDSIVGFGSYSYQSGGRNHEWFKVGSPHASSTSRSTWVMDARRNGISSTFSVLTGRARRVSTSKTYGRSTGA